MDSKQVMVSTLLGCINPFSNVSFDAFLSLYTYKSISFRNRFWFQSYPKSTSMTNAYAIKHGVEVSKGSLPISPMLKKKKKKKILTSTTKFVQQNGITFF